MMNKRILLLGIIAVLMILLAGSVFAEYRAGQNIWVYKEGGALSLHYNIQTGANNQLVLYKVETDGSQNAVREVNSEARIATFVDLSLDIRGVDVYRTQGNIPPDRETRPFEGYTGDGWEQVKLTTPPQSGISTEVPEGEEAPAAGGGETNATTTPAGGQPAGTPAAPTLIKTTGGASASLIGTSSGQGGTEQSKPNLVNVQIDKNNDGKYNTADGDYEIPLTPAQYDYIKSGCTLNLQTNEFDKTGTSTSYLFGKNGETAIRNKDQNTFTLLSSDSKNMGLFSCSHIVFTVTNTWDIFDDKNNRMSTVSYANGIESQAYYTGANNGKTEIYPQGRTGDVFVIISVPTSELDKLNGVSQITRVSGNTLYFGKDGALGSMTVTKDANGISTIAVTKQATAGNPVTTTVMSVPGLDSTITVRGELKSGAEVEYKGKTYIYRGTDGSTVKLESKQDSKNTMELTVNPTYTVQREVKSDGTRETNKFFTKDTDNQNEEGWHKEGEKTTTQIDSQGKPVKDLCVDQKGNTIYETKYYAQGYGEGTTSVRKNYNTKSGDLISTQTAKGILESNFGDPKANPGMIYSKDGFIVYKDASWNDNAEQPKGVKDTQDNGKVEPWEVTGTAYAEGPAGIGLYQVERDPRTGMVTKYGKEITEKDNPELYREIKNEIDARWNQGFWRGEDVYLRGTIGAQGGLSTQLAAIVAAYQDRTALSSALFGKSGLNKWMETVDEVFAKMNLGVEYWVSDICKKEFDTVGDSTAYIETPGGLVQLIAHVEGEKTAWLPNAQDPNKQRFYKLTFGVTAPSDQKMTPQLDEEGAVSFNVILKTSDGKTTYLFINERTKKPAPINLKNGASYTASGSSAKVFYSSRNYETISIVFEKKPENREGKEITSISNTIPESTGAIDNYFASLESEDENAPEESEGGEPASEEEDNIIINPDL
jgi:hypothetical protein